MKIMCRNLVFAAVSALLPVLPSHALADGFFGQFDIGNKTAGGVISVQRGKLTYGLNATRYDGGEELTATLLFSLPATPIAQVKVGPTVGLKWSDGGDREFKGGARMTVEKYSPTSFGSIFLLGDFSTLHQSWFMLGQVNLNSIGSGFELSRGGSDSYHETTFAYRKDITGTHWSLRAGYKLDSKEAFVGFSINTF